MCRRARLDVCTLHLSSLHSPFDSFTSQPDLLHGYSTSVASHPPPPWAWCLPRSAKDQAQGRHIVARRAHLSQPSSHAHVQAYYFRLSRPTRASPCLPLRPRSSWEGPRQIRVGLLSSSSAALVFPTCMYGILCSVCTIDAPFHPISDNTPTCFPSLPIFLCLSHL